MSRRSGLLEMGINEHITILSNDANTFVFEVGVSDADADMLTDFAWYVDGYLLKGHGDMTDIVPTNPLWLNAAFQQNVAGGETQGTVAFTMQKAQLPADLVALRIRLSISDGEATSRATVYIGGPAGEEPALALFGIMGQEDRYREEGGERVDNGGMARVVWETSVPTTSTVNFGFSPVISEVFVNETLTRQHEVFFPVSPAATYVFTVTGETADGDYLESGRYYFDTGGTLASGDIITIAVPSPVLLGAPQTWQQTVVLAGGQGGLSPNEGGGGSVGIHFEKELAPFDESQVQPVTPTTSVTFVIN